MSSSDPFPEQVCGSGCNCTAVLRFVPTVQDIVVRVERSHLSKSGLSAGAQLREICVVGVSSAIRDTRPRGGVRVGAGGHRPRGPATAIGRRV